MREKLIKFGNKAFQLVGLSVLIFIPSFLGLYWYFEQIVESVNELENRDGIVVEIVRAEVVDTDVEDIEDIHVAEVSAYTSEVAQTDASPYITADGTNLKKVYECVVASNDYEFGTKLAIEELGVCTVHDRMNSRYTGQNRIDVYMGNDKVRALEFGVKELSYMLVE